MIAETIGTTSLIGAGVDRVDGPQKVTGAARYPSDVYLPNLAHAALVRSTVAAGRIRHIDTEVAAAAPGVLAAITHQNAPKLARGPMTPLGPSPPPPLQDNRILHHGQLIAVVVAETAEQAAAAARLVAVEYEQTEPLLDLKDTRAELLTNPWGLDTQRGEVTSGLSPSTVRFEAAYTTPENTNNPLGLFATVATWEGDALTVHDSTQWPRNVRATLAMVLGIPESSVRVLAPFVGGGFGAGLRVWPHVILAAVAARAIGRPVKLVLTRPQMFTSVGHRPNSRQQIKLAATGEGELAAIEHVATSSVAMADDNIEPITWATAGAYACPNLATRDQQVRLNVAPPGSMRAPGTAEGNFALECALDELAYRLGMDPLTLRMRNYTAVQPESGLPWSSNALRTCYQAGAERFGWSRRTPEPRSMRNGRWLVGYGMAGVTYHWYQVPCQARATLHHDGTAYVRSAATDIGTGTYTVMTQVAADTLGLPLDRVRFDLGDSNMPMSPQAGGSGLTAALSTAVLAACQQLVQAFLDVVRNDVDSPLHGCRREEVVVSEGRIHHDGDTRRGEAYGDILARHQLNELTADGESTPLKAQNLGMAPAPPFGAQFVEAQVDPDLGFVRVTRVVSAIDGGRILNEKLARSQIIGGVVGGIGMALFEETVSDVGTGRIANATFSDYLVPVNADVPDMEVIFVGEADRMTPLGVKGVGEIGLIGIPPAIANAVFHATGRRVRSLPITIERLL